ncbi:Hsp20/alpha crystallin family protein [bacterium]|nr:Hsp20/alpha crystallin family protein [bacterium]
MVEKTVPAIQSEKQVPSREVTRNPDQYVSPLCDIFETPEGLTVQADLPGVEKGGVEIKVENGLLTIEGKIQLRPQRQKLFEEFAPVNFFRQFELPEKVDQEKIMADLKHGVLTLVLPHVEKQKPRQIEVTVS